MLLTHILNNQKISKAVNHEATLLAANNLGGYLWLGDNANQSRYQGWHVRLKGEVYKILDEIKINPKEEIHELRNIWVKNTNYLQRIYKNATETYYMPKIQNALVYELSQIRNIELILDIRKSYSSSQQERHYDIYEKGDFIIIKYNDKELKEPLFLAIFTPFLKNWEKTEKWVKKEGIFDRKRNSPPYFLYVYHILTLKTDRLIMGVGLSEKEAITNTNSTNLHELTQILVDISEISDISKIINIGANSLAYNLAKKSLSSLLVYNNNHKTIGLYAGLPWFFQFWSRDESISLKGLAMISPKTAGEILKKSIKAIKPYKHKAFTALPAFRASVDGLQWTVYRLLEKIQETQDVNRDPIINAKKISQIIRYITDYYIDKNGLIITKSSSTWMDSALRPQFPIEMQALQLVIYNLAYKITKEAKYKDMEKQLKNKVRSYFWDGKMLADGKNDWTIRPNIFLTYYIYPGLLKKSEWENCFETALKALWLDWGGLSTIDKNSPFHHAKHTGENPKSYHQGDSWFWINNIAAISMIRLNKEKYLSKIEKIFKASTEDLLWHGAIGHSSELSSAQKFNPAGSISQAWSIATYIELFNLLNAHNT